MTKSEQELKLEQLLSKVSVRAKTTSQSKPVKHIGGLFSYCDSEKESLEVNIDSKLKKRFLEFIRLRENDRGDIKKKLLPIYVSYAINEYIENHKKSIPEFLRNLIEDDEEEGDSKDE